MHNRAWAHHRAWALLQTNSECENCNDNCHAVLPPAGGQSGSGVGVILPQFEPIRSDPRFAELARRVKATNERIAERA